MDNIETMIADARRSNHYSLRPQSATCLTPDLFGKLLFAQWASQKGRSDFPMRHLVIEALLSHAESAPAEIKGVMQLEDRITGPTIAQYTEYAQGAQADRLIKRYNPDYVRISVEIDNLTGQHLVEHYTQGRPEVRKWIESVIEYLIARSGQAAHERSDESGRIVEAFA